MKVVITLICLAALAGVAWLVSSIDMGSLAQVQWLIAAVAVGAAVVRWRAIARRRQRQKLQEMRDSALW
jgi:membrane protein implicated in regulation of membrane protease activity